MRALAASSHFISIPFIPCSTDSRSADGSRALGSRSPRSAGAASTGSLRKGDACWLNRRRHGKHSSRLCGALRETNMPDWAEHVRPRLSTLRLSPGREAEIVEELSQHLDDRWRELIAGGASPDEAARLALADFRKGNLLVRYMAPLRQAHLPSPITLGEPRGPLFRDLWKDLRYGVRQLLHSPGFTAVAITTLALSVGPMRRFSVL